VVRLALATFGIATLASGIRLYGVLSLLAALLYLPGIATVPPVDRDEARFMQAAKQMVESADYGVIRFQDQPRDKKPPGAYWLQALSLAAFSPDTLTRTWPYRLPSVLGVGLAVLMTAFAASRTFGPATGLFAGAILATSLLVVVEAHLAKADALLLGCSAACFAGLLAAYTQPRPPGVLIAGFWTALGAGVLIKGPISVAIVVLAVGALGVIDRNLRWFGKLSPARGVMASMAIASVWVWVSGWTEVARFSGSAISQDLLPKILGGVESHGAPPGAHLLASLATLWPWTFLLPLAAVVAWRERRDPIVKLCVAWAVPFWILLELTPTKLPHYVLPLLPAVATLMGHALRLAAIGTPILERPWQRNLVAVVLLVGIFAPLLLAAQAAGLTVLKNPDTASLVGFGCAALLLLIAAGRVQVWQLGRAAVLTIAACVLTSATFFSVRVTTLDAIRVSSMLAAQIDVHRASPTAAIILVGYHEPSAVFLLGTPTRLSTAREAAGLMAAAPDAVAAVATGELAAFERHLALAGKKSAALAEVSGYNYGRGEAVTLVVVKAIPAAP
jgi:hypothetical protein